MLIFCLVAAKFTQSADPDKYGKSLTDRLDDTMITVEKEYSINITKARTKICWNLHYNRSNSYLYGNHVEIYKFKAKGSKIKPCSLCLGNISKYFTINNMKIIELNGYIYRISLLIIILLMLEILWIFINI